jgi:hypothetical protein
MPRTSEPEPIQDYARYRANRASRPRRGEGVLDLREAGNARRSADGGPRRPAVRGGSHDRSNLRAGHLSCNSARGDRPPVPTGDPGRVARASSAASGGASSRSRSRRGRARAGGRCRATAARSRSRRSTAARRRVTGSASRSSSASVPEGVPRGGARRRDRGRDPHDGRGNGKSTEGGGLGVWARVRRRRHRRAAGPGRRDDGRPGDQVVLRRRRRDGRHGARAPESRPGLHRRRDAADLRAVQPRRALPGQQRRRRAAGPRPSIAIIDEIGFQPVESYAALKLAGGKRERSLLLGLGTKGTNPTTRSSMSAGRCSESSAASRDSSTASTRRRRRSRSTTRRLAACQPGARRGLPPRIGDRLGPVAARGLFRIFRLNQSIEGADSWLGTERRGRLGRALHPRRADVPGRGRGSGSTSR